MLIAGIDECGRGPLAGPVVAAAVILPSEHGIIGLADSKKLSVKKRAELEPVIKQKSLAWSIAEVEAAKIDQINILQASLLAMKKTIDQLAVTPTKALIDGKFIPDGLQCDAQAIVNGDSLVDVISAASILAKEYRDRLLRDFDQVYPGYGFASHKGYPTKAHLHALQQYGVTPIHRRSFAPVTRVFENI